MSLLASLNRFVRHLSHHEKAFHYFVPSRSVQNPPALLRHPIGDNALGGTGISTCCASTTPSGLPLALAHQPREISLAQETGSSDMLSSRYSASILFWTVTVGYPTASAHYRKLLLPPVQV